MIKSTIFAIFSAFVFFSCTEVVFESPQPQGVEELKEIPSGLIGSYSFVVLNEQQVIEITEDFFEGEDGKQFLSDSLIIKKVDNFYFINQKINNEGDTFGKWSVFIFEEKGCGFLKATTFVISEDEDIEAFIEAYSATPAGEGQEKSLIINPDKKQFEDLIKDKSATLSIILEKIE